jgi:hypothetical protein
MIKKINSEYKIKNDNSPFIITMGTSNKKAPEVIYSVISTYITPKTHEINDSLFGKISKRIKNNLKASISEFGLCEKDVIVVSDVATNRMLCGKPSYFDMEIYFKPKKELLNDKNIKFKELSNSIYNTYVMNIVDEIENEFSINGFHTSKTKNKVTVG